MGSTTTYLHFLFSLEQVQRELNVPSPPFNNKKIKFKSKSTIFFCFCFSFLLKLIFLLLKGGE